MNIAYCHRCGQKFEYSEEAEGEEIVCSGCDNITRLECTETREAGAEAPSGDATTEPEEMVDLTGLNFHIEEKFPNGQPKTGNYPVVITVKIGDRAFAKKVTRTAGSTETEYNERILLTQAVQTEKFKPVTTDNEAGSGIYDDASGLEFSIEESMPDGVPAEGAYPVVVTVTIGREQFERKFMRVVGTPVKPLNAVEMLVAAVEADGFQPVKPKGP